MERIRSAENDSVSPGMLVVAAMSLVLWHFVQRGGYIESSLWVAIVMHAGRMVKILEWLV